MAERLGMRKAKNPGQRRRTVFAGSVGCLIQIMRYLKQERPELWVAHPVDALWASYEGIHHRRPV